MGRMKKIVIGIVAVLVVLAIGVWLFTRPDTADLTLAQTTGPRPTLPDPEPETFPTIFTAKPVGWSGGSTPTAAAEFAVSRFAVGLNHPRTIVTLPNGDVLVAETNSPPRDVKGVEGFVMNLLLKRVGAGGPSPNRIKLLRDGDGDGRAEQVFDLGLQGLDSPSGMVLREDRLIVANHDAVLSYPFKVGDTRVGGAPQKLMDLPGGGNHWMRNLLLSPDGGRLYVAVGSSSNIAENGIAKEKGRAAIHEYDFAKKSSRIYASGLRNPNGMDWNPDSGELWTVVNERDMLGSDLVPDYLTNVPFGVTYGWPWIYWKETIDDRVKDPLPDLMLGYVRKPEYALGAHTAALGLVFSRPGTLMGERYAHGAFVARHGSWNRKPLSGYDVIFVPFDSRGNVTKGQPVPVLTGFVSEGREARGRPTWLAWAKDGALLVSDDVGGVIWRVVGAGGKPGAPAASPGAARAGKTAG
jgi:glucose/arabinose dehydrogenase